VPVPLRLQLSEKNKYNLLSGGIHDVFSVALKTLGPMSVSIQEKMTFRPNKPHLGKCMVTRGHFITIKISFREETAGAQSKGTGDAQRAAAPCPFSRPLWRRPCS